MSIGPYIENIEVWDLTYLETGGGTTLLGEVAFIGTGTIAVTPVVTLVGIVDITGVGTFTVTAAAAINGAVDFTGVGNVTFSAVTWSNEFVSENLTLDDIITFTVAYNKFVSDNLKVKDFLFPSAFYNREFTDGLTINDTALTDFIAYITETLQANDTLSSQGNFAVFSLDSVQLRDNLYVAFPISLLEDVTLADAPTDVHARIVHLLSRMSVGDLPSSSALFYTSTGEAITIDDVMFNGWIEALVASLDASDTVSSRWAGFVENLDDISISDPLSDVLSAYLGVTNTMALDDSNLSKQEHTGAEISENIGIGVIFDDLATSGWVMNPENYAVSKYTLGFNETAVYDNNFLMADDTGLYALEGTTDDGSEIVSSITTASLDFGHDGLKQVPQVLLGTNGTDVVLKVSIDGSYTAFYELANQPSEFHTKRIKVGKGLIGNNWQFTLMTTNNSVLDLDSFEFYPIRLKRNHNG